MEVVNILFGILPMVMQIADAIQKLHSVLGAKEDLKQLAI